MKCGDMAAIVSRHLEDFRRALGAELPGLIFVGVVVADENCDARPGQVHVETQVTNRPDVPKDARAVFMETAAAQVRAGRADAPHRAVLS